MSINIVNNEAGGNYGVSKETRQIIFNRAEGKCEKCRKLLVFENHKEGQLGAWEAHHRTSVASGGNNVASNGKALCLNCHKATYSYGRLM